MNTDTRDRTGFVLPVGTVTLLLADIEGSTRLWEADASAMTGAVERLNALVDDVIGRHDGVRPVEQGEGDSFVAAFARASDGVAAALEVQRRLASQDVGLGVRMGLHSGDVQKRDAGNYIGAAVNRCARVRELAWGGQTLLTAATRDLVVDDLPEGASLVDLGTLRLRDLARPEQLWQLCHPDLAGTYPPPRSLDTVPNNLPAQLTSFVGRQKEMADVVQLLGSSRLLTLTGSGGCGKTRLALQSAAAVSDHFAGGVWFCDLGALSDPALVPDGVASALSIRDEPGRTMQESVIARLRRSRALLILDNCEHLISACAALVDAALRGCPDLTVLATSREPLGVEGEVAWRVPSMELPNVEAKVSIDALTAADAVRLFIDRARQARPNFAVTNDNAPHVADICVRLDGIPLAIELAAARVRVLAPEQIVAGLADRFRMLGGGARTAQPRQQTLLASVAWSHDLLAEDERVLLRRLAVFAGGFDLDAAESVVGGEGLDRYHVLETLAALVDRSLVTMDDSAGLARYRMLETIRQFAYERLSQAGEATAFRDRHLTYFADRAEALDEAPVEGRLREMRDLLPDHDNIRAALAWSLESGRIDDGLRLGGSLGRWWTFSAYRYAEPRRWLEDLLALADDGVSRRWVAAAELAAADISIFMFDYGRAIPAFHRALELARAGGWRRLEANAQTHLALAYSIGLDDDRAVTTVKEAVEAAREADDPWTLSYALAMAGWVDNQAGRFSRALPAFEQALATGGEKPPLGQPMQGLTTALSGVGRVREACAIGERAMAEAEALGDPYYLIVMAMTLCRTKLMAGDAEAAARHLDHIASYPQVTAFPAYELWDSVNRVSLLNAQDRQDEAEQLAERTLDRARQTGMMHQVAGTLSQLAAFAIRRGDFATARARLDEFRALGPQSSTSFALSPEFFEGYMALEEGRPELAEATARDLLGTTAQFGPTLLVPILELLAMALTVLEAHDEGARLFAAAMADRDRMGLPRLGFWRKRVEAGIASARAAADFESRWAEGAAMSLDEAIAFATRGRGPRNRPSTGWASLTPSELAVARLVGEGLTNAQIGKRLFISVRTVQTHVHHIFGKLSITSRAQLVAEALRRRE